MITLDIEFTRTKMPASPFELKQDMKQNAGWPSSPQANTEN